jgi:L-malate glycosyltransferase
VKRIRVLHVVKTLGLGGAERLLLEGQRLRKADEFDIGYVFFMNPALAPALRAESAFVHQIPRRSSPSMFTGLPELVRVVRKFKPDIIHCHLPLAGVMGRIAGRIAGVPVVYTEHNRLERYHPLTRRANLGTWNWQRSVIACSADVAESIQGFTASVPVRVIQNGVDTALFRRDADGAARVRADYGIAPDTPLVGTVTVFKEQKRLDIWLDAARLINEELPQARFMIVGWGPLEQEVRAMARERKLEDCVIFAGVQPDVRPFLSAFDVYLMSSDVEGLPVALLEAMSMECGIVATRVGGIPEAIESGVNGWLCERGEPAQLAARTMVLLRDPELRRKLGEAARTTVHARFGMEAMIREVEATYRRAIGTAP